MNLNDPYCEVPFVRPTFNKQNMRNDKLVSQNNQIKSDENNDYSSQRRSITTADGSGIALHAYREKQERNKYSNLTSQIGYDGINSAFIF